MIFDYEQELTVANGHDIAAIGNNATVYGSRPYDLKAAGVNANIGGLTLMFQILGADVTTATSIAIGLVTDTDGAGTGAVTLLSRVYAIAALTVAAGVQEVGLIPSPGVAFKRYLTAQFIAVGDPAGAAFCKVWIKRGLYQLPQNTGVNI